MIAQQGTVLISAARIRHNLELFRTQMGASSAGPDGVKICATVKANAYGHGLKKLLPLLHDAGVGWYCVYNLTEAMALSELAGVLLTQDDNVGIQILTLSPLVLSGQDGVGVPLDPGFLALLAGSPVRITLTDCASAERLASGLRHAGVADRLRVHVQVDTGLTRSGVSCAEAPALITFIENSPELQLEGLYSHFSHGDEPGHVTVALQMERLWAIAGPVKARHPELLVHVQNSGGAWHTQPKGGGVESSRQAAAQTFAFARLGIGLYGLQPSTVDPISGLLPVARLVAPILAIHERPAGVGVGYGHTFMTERTSRLAIVPVGYADGYPRALSNKGIVQLRAGACGGAQTASLAPTEARVVGRVSMDQIIVDVTDIPWAAVGHEVTVFSDNPQDANSVDRIADQLGTIGYELVTHLGSRLRRCVV